MYFFLFSNDLLSDIGAGHFVKFITDGGNKFRPVANFGGFYKDLLRWAVHMIIDHCCLR